MAETERDRIQGPFDTKKSLWNCGRHLSAQRRMGGQAGFLWCRSMLLCRRWGGFYSQWLEDDDQQKTPKGLMTKFCCLHIWMESTIISRNGCLQ